MFDVNQEMHKHAENVFIFANSYNFIKQIFIGVVWCLILMKHLKNAGR